MRSNVGAFPTGAAYGGKHGVPAAVVSQVQRERLLEAMVVVAAESRLPGGQRRAHARAGASVSRRTFYDLFEDREDCFIAAYDEIMAHVVALMVEAFDEVGLGRAAHEAGACDAFFDVLHRGARGRARMHRRGAGSRPACARAP